MKCQQCGRELVRFCTRETNEVVTKKVGLESTLHTHYGNPTIKYGICSYHHYSKLEQISVAWKPCKKCKENGEAIEKKRQFLLSKQKKKNREIPSFLRDELDKFKVKMEEKIREEVRNEVKNEVDLLVGLLEPPPIPPYDPDLFKSSKTYSKVITKEIT